MVREVGMSEGDKAFKGPVKVRQSQQLLSECSDGVDSEVSRISLPSILCKCPVY